METKRYRREKLMIRLVIRCSRSIEEIEAKSAMLKRWMERRIWRTRTHGNEYQLDDWVIAGDVFVYRDPWVGFSRVWLYVGAYAYRNPRPGHRQTLANAVEPIAVIAELEPIAVQSLTG